MVKNISIENRFLLLFDEFSVKYLLKKDLIAQDIKLRYLPDDLKKIDCQILWNVWAVNYPQLTEEYFKKKF